MSSILASFITGQQAGRQNHAYGQEQSKLVQLRELAPSVLAGDPAAYGQAAALDIDQANKLQTGRDGQLRRFGGFIKFIDEAKASGDPRRLSAAMREAAPYLQQLGAPAFDPNAPWTPEYDAGWAALKAQYEGAMAGGTGDTLHSQKIGADGYIYNTFRGGRVVNTGVKADRQMWFRDHPGMDPQLVGKDGAVQVVGMGQPAAGTAPAGANAPQRSDMEADIELANSMIAAGIPEAQVDAFLVQRGQRASAAAPAPAGYGAPAGGSLARPSAAQEAAATEAARQQVQLQFLPQELAARGQAAVDQAVGIEQGKAGIESQSTARAKSASLNNVDRGLERIDRAMAALSGGYVNTGPIDGRLMIATEAGQELDRAVGAIQNDLLALTRVPGIGSQSDMETKIANLKYPSIYNHPEVNRRNLQQLQAFMADLRTQIQGGQAGGQQAAQPQQSQRPVMVHSPADYSALPAGALYTAPDGSTRRKK